MQYRCLRPRDSGSSVLGVLSMSKGEVSWALEKGGLRSCLLPGRRWALVRPRAQPMALDGHFLLH